MRSKNGLLETVAEYAEFQAKIDTDEPIHHTAYSFPNPGGTVRNVLRIYAIARRGHVICFEATFETFQTQGPEKAAEKLREMVDEWAAPLGSTPGRLRSLTGGRE